MPAFSLKSKNGKSIYALGSAISPDEPREFSGTAEEVDAMHRQVFHSCILPAKDGGQLEITPDPFAPERAVYAEARGVDPDPDDPKAPELDRMAAAKAAHIAKIAWRNRVRANMAAPRAQNARAGASAATARE